ncbi:MAG: hypothetical protein JJ863_25265 [Deltaproteobacteria bacterium]|nr:hypothetical protein [Deltaproteobacteria bacterium]
MEYTDYNVVRGPAAKVRKALAEVTDSAVLVDDQGDFVPFVMSGDTGVLPKHFDWYLSIFDAEGGAWGFAMCVDGAEVGAATYGENAEWGIEAKDNGFRGDLTATAKAIGASTEALEKCFHSDGADAFCKLVGFAHQYMLYPHEHEMPEGVVLLSEMG